MGEIPIPTVKVWMEEANDFGWKGSPCVWGPFFVLCAVQLKSLLQPPLSGAAAFVRKTHENRLGKKSNITDYAQFLVRFCIAFPYKVPSEALTFRKLPSVPEYPVL